ncbi:peptidase inhibitor family I36 protein [Amycolatopsis sp. OK19-0408]|uniref:Peptidase inhibitor family I36 protein n=1 Tax=Amycolatopsis iheyensis TaxID=2945988 RepID=A0A9X2NA87_9PSEU|nr:peptidase inhibitor family I36 protein [Amycolatopsis iheyensis]MCR6483482.1 peptidase inhibitor family I36 protein [Amycolatopsis iheyensis]
MSSRRLRSHLPVLLVLALAGLLTSAGAAQAASEPGCQKGEFCLWPADDYGGTPQRFDLRTANPGECIPLPAEFAGSSFANLMSRDVTVYQSEECSTEGDFITYPGGGTFVPDAPFLVRGIQIWE